MSPPAGGRKGRPYGALGGNANENSDSVVGGLPSSPALSDSEGLTVYDAAYLALAIERRAKLATADKALAAAARRRGIR